MKGSFRIGGCMRWLAAPLLLSLVLSSGGADWPCWRGPDGLGVSAEKNLPVQWGPAQNLRWRKAIPGTGASSPIVVKDRIYLTTQTADRGLHVLAIDKERGEILWDREIGRGNKPANKLHNMATPTAVSDGNLVWAQFGTGDLVCLNAAGEIQWQRDLVKELGDYKFNHGYGSSPMVDAGRLFVVCMHQGPSYLLALDARTGKDVWKADRALDSKGEAQDSYSSPLFVRSGGRKWLVLHGAEGVDAYDPDRGQRAWITKGLNVEHPYGRTIAGAAAGEGMIVAVASGFQNRGYTVGLKPPAAGKGGEAERVWTSTRFSPDCPTPVVYQGQVFAIRDDGMASCLDLKTGEPHWQERLFSANVKVSPVAGDGKVYFMSGQGNCAVVKAALKFEVLATNNFNEATLSTPAISGGKLYLRTAGNLYAVGN